MSIRRGLLRVWILASAVWVAGTVYTGWTELSEMADGDKYDYLISAAPEVFSTGQQACLATRANKPVNAFDDIAPDKPAVMERLRRQCVDYRMHIPMVTLVPPLALLAFGYAIAWVIGGFKTPEWRLKERIKMLLADPASPYFADLPPERAEMLHAALSFDVHTIPSAADVACVLIPGLLEDAKAEEFGSIRKWNRHRKALSI
jgi:hypothetical protein